MVWVKIYSENKNVFSETQEQNILKVYIVLFSQSQNIVVNIIQAVRRIYASYIRLLVIAVSFVQDLLYGNGVFKTTSARVWLCIIFLCLNLPPISCIQNSEYIIRTTGHQASAIPMYWVLNVYTYVILVERCIVLFPQRTNLPYVHILSLYLFVYIIIRTLVAAEKHLDYSLYPMYLFYGLF